MSDECGQIILDSEYIHKDKKIRIRLALFDDSVILYELRKGSVWHKAKVWELPSMKYKRKEREDLVKAATTHFKNLISKNARMRSNGDH
jgi:hypothetical protein